MNAETPAPRPVPQRLTLVLPSSGAFDSRTFRIASGLAARGHEVTVIARRARDLPDEERHPAGYMVRRVPWDPVDGLPGPLRLIARRLKRGRGDATAESGAPSAATRAMVPPTASSPTGARSGLVKRTVGTASRAWASLVRLAAIGLTVRSQGSATLRVAPPTDLVHAMAYMGIPAGLRLGRRDRAPVVYDARDIYTDAQNIARMPKPMRSFLARLERGWARQASRVMTVNVPYGEVMASRWEVPMPAVVLNCSYRQEPPAERPRRFHERLGLKPAARVVLYQGGFSRDRGIEELIQAIPSIDGAVLVLLGYGALEAEILRRVAAANLGDRVHIVPAVPPEELLSWVASADVVAMPIQPSNLNHRLTTPNKLFEAMAVGVPVVASDLPGMATIVRETGCGVVCDPTDPAAIATAVRSILDGPAAEREAIRSRALAAASGSYCWEAQLDVLITEYARLTGRPW
jgi:glycosyltransferase involved in cell wall biosynthesis